MVEKDMETFDVGPQNQPNSNVEFDKMEKVSLHNLVFSDISPRYRLINILSSLIFGVGLVFVLMAFIYQPFSPISDKTQTVLLYIMLGIGVFTVFSVVYHFFADPIVQYAVREHDVHFKSGLFFRKILTQPVLRIQHIEIERGPIERLAGLSTLQVFSAGGGSHTFQIPGLSEEVAVQLRQFILEHKSSTLHD